MTLADELATDLQAASRDVQRIQALSRTRPHIFAEQKDELSKRLDKLAVRIRNSFGGTPARIVTGSIVDRNNRTVRVERRRRQAA